MSTAWNKDSDVIFERFAAGIDEAVCSGEKLECADRDLRYGISLQNKRIKDKGLRLEYELTPRGQIPEGMSLMSRWTDGHYTNRLECRSCLKKETYYRDNVPMLKSKENVQLYQTVTDTSSDKAAVDDEYVCPDCGAVSTIGQLIDGCSYCGNKFKMSELYPKISNYYFTIDVSGTHGEMGKMALKYILISVAAIFAPFLMLGLLIMFFGSDSFDNGVKILIGGGILAFFAGGAVGWIITAVKYSARFGRYASRRLPMAKYLGSQKRFEEFMKKLSPEFSYEFFAGKVVSMIKMAVFSDNPMELPFYNGKPLDPSFADIVDVSSMGAVGIDDLQIAEDYAYVFADVFLDNVYYRNGRVFKVTEVFRAVMKKNVAAPVNINFKITSIHCLHCAGSFDATKHRTCPYCGSSYQMEDMDWSIEFLGRKNA